MPSRLDTCNEALAEISAGSIASLDEDSVEAKECLRFYRPTLSDLLEMHDWGFAKRRVQLAQLVNARPFEWLYAYAKPEDVASLGRILPYQQDVYESLGPLRYVEDAGTIYTNVATASLEYITKAIEPGDMPALFRRALVYELASRLAMPIRKDRQIKGDMLQLAMAARREAMADDRNRNPQMQPDYVAEASGARLGVVPDAVMRRW